MLNNRQKEFLRFNDKSETTIKEYNYSATLYDRNNNVITTGYVVVFPGGQIIEVDENGKFEIEGLENGTYRIYYVSGKTKEEIEGLTEEEIANLPNVTKGTLSINSVNNEIEFDNGIKAKNGEITEIQTQKHKVIYDGIENGGTTTQEVTVLESEMGEEQQKIYLSYLANVKEDVANLIEENGYGKIGDDEWIALKFAKKL